VLAEAKAAKKQKVKKEKEKKAPTADEEEQKADQSGKVGKGASSSSTPAANEKEAAAELTPAAAPSGDADTPMTEAAADGGVTHGSSTTTNAATAGDAGTKRFSDQLTVFVSSLSFDVNEEDLREVFAPCGSLKEVTPCPKPPCRTQGRRDGPTSRFRCSKSVGREAAREACTQGDVHAASTPTHHRGGGA
jgi:hypothetical protein